MLFAAGRVAFGAGMILAPRRVAHAWIGDDADRPPVELLVRAVGARDIVIGAGAIAALAGNQPAKTWLRAGVAADLADAAITARYFSKLPRQGAIATIALAIVVAYTGNRVAASTS
jgi:hypothetical protein